MQNTIDLKADPLTIFQADDSPASLYARSHWMRGRKAASRVAKDQAKSILAAQEKNGSWEHSVATTIQNLYSLHLLGVGANPSVRKSVDWLLETDRPAFRYQNADGTSYDDLFFKTFKGDPTRLRKMTGVPFTGGCSGFVKSGAALFLATAFGCGDAGRIARAFETFSRMATSPKREGRFCSQSCGNNPFLAIAAHPDLQASPAAAKAVGHIGRLQLPNGSWDCGTPFFPTFWALSHLPQGEARAQFERAVAKLPRLQNRDGSWGRTDKGFRTFLVVDALKRAGIEMRAA